jgi:hypothetical protein
MRAGVSFSLPILTTIARHDTLRCAMDIQLSPFHRRYVYGWVSFSLLALALAFHDRRALAAEWRLYLRLLGVRWKLLVFVPAVLFVTSAGRFTDDETWDMTSGGGMAVLTILTSGWVVGVIYKVLAGERPVRWLVLAAAAWLFSSSWFYDGYLLLRDGAYTRRWLGNLMLSPIIYLCAGLLTNLEGDPVKPWRFLAFQRPDWPAAPVRPAFTLMVGVLCVPLILIGAFILVAFVDWGF